MAPFSVTNVTDERRLRGDGAPRRNARMHRLPVALSLFILLSEVAFAETAGKPARPADITIAQVRAVMAGDKNLAGKSLESLDLSDMNLSGANLSGSDLRGAKLDHTDLKNANLSHADLDDSSLLGADFAGADMEGASLNSPIVAIGATAKPEDVPIFRGSDLNDARILIAKNDSQLGADFSHARLEHADFSRANLANVIFKDADLKLAKLTGASLCGADLTNANFDQAELKDADFNCVKGLDHAKNLSTARDFQQP